MGTGRGRRTCRSCWRRRANALRSPPAENTRSWEEPAPRPARRRRRARADSKAVDQLVEHLVAERVAGLGRVERDVRDGVVDARSGRAWSSSGQTSPGRPCRTPRRSRAGVGRRDVVEREGAVDDRRPDVVLAEQPQQAGEVGRAAHRGAEQRVLGEVVGADVEVAPAQPREAPSTTSRPPGRSGPTSDSAQVPPSRGRRRSRRRPGSAPWPPPASRGRRTATPPTAPSSRAARSSRALDDVTTTAAADRRSPGDRHRGDAAAGAEHEQRLPRRQPGAGDSARYVVTPTSGSAAASAHDSPVGLRHDALGRHGHLLGVGAVAVVAEDLPRGAGCGLVVTPPQRRDDDDLLAGLGVDAGAVGAGHVRERRAVACPAARARRAS